MLYTDVWVSMGQEEEARLKAFQGYQINGDMIQEPKPMSWFCVACLPKGLEITDEVMDVYSKVFDEAKTASMFKKLFC